MKAAVLLPFTDFLASSSCICTSASYPHSRLSSGSFQDLYSLLCHLCSYASTPDTIGLSQYTELAHIDWSSF
jgi:hypothetical protein